MINFTLHASEESVKRAVHDALLDAFDEIETHMEERTTEAEDRIRVNVSGPHTDAPVLRFRSGEASASISKQVTRKKDFFVFAEVGVLSGTPDVEQYMHVQEEGETLRPRFAEKLAFPPGEGWSDAVRDSAGVQIATARSMMDEIRDGGTPGGFVWLQFHEDSIWGVDAATEMETELLFIRADSVRIPARRPVGKEADQLEKDLRLDFAEISL